MTVANATTVAKVIELSASSPNSFDDAVANGIEKANSTLSNVSGAWVKEMKAVVEDGRVSEYRVDLKVTFLLE